MTSDSDIELDSTLFQDPEGYTTPEDKPTFAIHTLRDGVHKIQVRMVSNSPLWGHFLWNAARVIANYIEDNASKYVQGKTVLELGAGAGLPSFLCATQGAELVTITDYPDPNLIENIRYNVEHSLTPDDAPKSVTSNVMIAEGFIWGKDPEPLLHHLPENRKSGYDLVILSDLLFNHSQHQALLRTLMQTMSPSGYALVFFTPHRPWLYEDDMNFFKAVEATDRLDCRSVLTEKCETPMDERDRGDRELRRTVFGYEIKWKENGTNIA